MKANHLIAACLAVASLGAIAAPHAAAQVVIGGRGGLWVGAGPGISIRVGRMGIVGPPAYVLPRRRLAAAGLYGVPPVAPAVDVYGLRRGVARPAIGDAPNQGTGQAAADLGAAPPSDLPLPTADELAAMADAEVLNAVLGLSAQLDADLNRFSSAASWQRYFRLPEDALPPPQNGRVTLGLHSLAAHEAKFNSVAENPNFAQIFSLPSFAATRLALAETTRRFGSGKEPQLPGDPRSEALEQPAGEELPLPPVPASPPLSASPLRQPLVTPTPTPTLAAPASNGTPERSILLVK